MNNLFYQDMLHEHYNNPRHKGVIPQAAIVAELHNPSCGDSIAITANAINDGIQEVKFTGQGCVISQAAASLLMEQLAGESFETILGYDKNYMLQLLGIALGPVRVKCALLPLEVVHKAVKDYMTQQESSHVGSHSINARISQKS